MSDINCIHHDDEEGLGGSVSGDSFPFQQSGHIRELPRPDVHTVSIRGNVSPCLSTGTHDVLHITTVPLSRVFDRFRNLGFNTFDRKTIDDGGVGGSISGGNVSLHLSTNTHDVLDTTTVPLSRVFDRFRNLGLNMFDRQAIENQEIQTTPQRKIFLSLGLVCAFLDEIMSDIDCIHHDDEEGLGGSVSGDSFSFQQSGHMRELPRLNVHTVSIRGNASPQIWGSTPLIGKTIDDGGVGGSVSGGNVSVGSHVGSPSVTAPVNHAYLCLNVTDCVIRPEIIPFSNSRLENAYQSHARGENSDTIGLMSPHNEVSASGKCSTSGTEHIVESSRLHAATSDAYSPIRYASTRSLAHGRTPSYIDLGNCNQQCRHCGCLFWYNERLKNNNYGRRAEYHLCCGGGKIYMPPTPDPPLFIQQLLTNSHFMEHIRAYNQMFAMTSFGAKVDNSVNMGRGPYVFKVSGQIYHWIGSLCPEEGHHPRFLQLYIYDTHAEVANRLRNFGHQDEDTLNPEIVEGLIHVLDEHNGLVRLFRTARDRCNAGEIPSFKIRLYNKGGARGYEFPTSDILGGIVFEDGPKSRTDFDVIIEFRGGLPQRITKLHQSYMSLQFPLLFVFGEPGFYPELVLKPRDGSGRGKKVTMNAYYKYQLHPQVKGFGLIFRCGRLFQQYVVTAFCVVEQSRLDFIRKRQNDLRSDYLLVLYTIEFQKRGLPHCHTLVWVDSSSKIQDASQIDKYISAELPDPMEDPKGYKVLSKLMMHGPCGVANPSAACTEKGICNKHFPKMYNDRTFFDTNGHTHYRRRQTQVHVMRGESRLDNCNMVPYNRPDRILGKIKRSIEDASTSTGERHIQFAPRLGIYILSDGTVASGSRRGRLSLDERKPFIAMSVTTSASLKVGQEDCIIEAKVYRKWTSKSIPEMKDQAFCCILIDRENTAFTYEAMITSLNNKRSWNYSSCSQCNKASVKRNGINTCEDHGEQEPPTYRYNFKATVADGTATAEFTFFTTAGQKITGHPCSHLRQKYEATDMSQLPVEIANTIGQKHVFQIDFAPSAQKGVARFIANDILDINPAAKKRNTGQMRKELTSKDKGVDTEFATSTALTTTDSTNED
ncbi:DNA helicase, partial [Tanacetum coccineum]